VRELRNAIARVSLMREAGIVGPEDLAGIFSNGPGVGSPRDAGQGGPCRVELLSGGVTLHVAERDRVLAALERMGFVQKDGAKLLCVTPRKLNYIFSRWGSPTPAGEGIASPRSAQTAI
jgi:transcriptional regulator with GAF, ATPase, and Fis domain